MARRKTIDILMLRDMANDYIRNVKDDMVKEREGVAALLESALHETGNYKGFRYLTRKDMESSMSGYSIGIDYDVEDEFKFVGCDKSRVEYF